MLFQVLQRKRSPNLVISLHKLDWFNIVPLPHYLTVKIYTKFQYWSKLKKKCKKVKSADVQPLQVSLPPHIIISYKDNTYTFYGIHLSELALPPPSKHPQGAQSIQWEGKVGKVLCGFTRTALAQHTPQQICLLQKLESRTCDYPENHQSWTDT